MSTHEKRLDKLEGTMTPCQLVLLLADKARSSGSLQQALIWYDKNSARVIAQMEAAVRDRQRDDPPAVLAKAIRAVRTQIAFLIQLWIASNECNRELADRSLPWVGLFEARVRGVWYLFQLQKQAASNSELGSDELVKQAMAARELGKEWLDGLSATKLAIATISRDYFKDQPIIFGGADERLSDRIDVVEVSCHLFNEILLVGGQNDESNSVRGVPRIDVVKIKKTAEARAHPIVDSLLEAAKSEALYSFDPITAIKQRLDPLLGKGQA